MNRHSDSRHRPLLSLAAALMCSALLASCSSSSSERATSVSTTTLAASTSTSGTSSGATASPIPGAAWDVVAPGSIGLDGAALDRIAARAKTGKSKCLAVARDGKLAGQWYFDGTNVDTTQDIFSATKSMTSVLVGIAQDDGDLRIDQRASKWITEWKGTPSESITIRDLLSNDSGRQWSLGIDYIQLIRSADRTAFAVGLGQDEPPGQVWAYNNSAIQTLQRVLEGATGQKVVTFAEKRLFEPLGMTHTKMTTDRAGNAQMFFGVHSNCQDLLRFGTLMLDRGRWGDKQIVSASWVDAATGHSSTPMNAAYGYLFWLNRKGRIGSPLVTTNLVEGPNVAKGQLVASAPVSTFWAIGLGNQIVQVDPGSRTIVVRLGPGEQPKPPTFGPAEASRVVTEAVDK